MRGDYYCLQKTDYSGLQRVLQNFTEGYIIYINKVVISVCLFVCLSDHNSEPMEQFASNFDWETRETYGNVISLAVRFRVEWVNF